MIGGAISKTRFTQFGEWLRITRHLHSFHRFPGLVEQAYQSFGERNGTGKRAICGSTLLDSARCLP